ncbi:hypothetical protein ACFQJC_13995 [Haloferax namakaokahaiae]|uniref:DUF7981 domain-containing protein n=1 Tax=Haloferax namakaokahaiae TaxID=1748331 RepID=A0ABD5ZHC7_9EURY
MNPTTKSALLWGVVGMLTTGVLAQGAVLFGVGPRLSVVAGVAMALVVGLVVAVVTYVIEPRIESKGRA